jgi:hypothetical protein
MAVIPSPPINPTAHLAQHLPGYDAGPVIAAQEQDLQDYLNLPVQEILARLGLPPLPQVAPGDLPPGALPPGALPPGTHGGEAGAGGSGGGPMNTDSLIKPVTDALGTLGSGMFQNLDPTKIFQGIGKAFESTAQSVQQAMGSLGDVWKGASGAATGAKTGAAMANGAEVGAQATGLGGSLTTAVTDVQQAQARLVEIIDEFHAKIAAIGPNIVFPWGQAAAVEAGTQATTMTTEVMTELQGSLGAQAGVVGAIGAPVAVTAAPQMGAEMIGPMLQMATSLISPLMQVGTEALSTGVGALTQAVQTGVQTGTGLLSSLTDAAGGGADAAATPAALASSTTPIGGIGAGGGGGGIGGSGAGAATMASRSVETSPMIQKETTNALATSSLSRTPAMGGAAAGGAGVMGGGGGAGMGGAGAGQKNSGSHTSAAFLHTTDQGDEIVGDLGTVAPPVIGEADPGDPPDVELRI